MYIARVLTLLALLVKMVISFSWDIAVTAGDRIEFYTDDGTETDTVRLNSQNLTALAYDELHNTLLYVDKQSEYDAICGYNMNSLDSRCYIQRNGRNIQGLAFDPVTELLFFTDTKERSINWFSFKPEFKNIVFGNHLIKTDPGIPTDIVVDSCRGYIYWINTNLPTSTIERARFDGSDREVVINATYQQDLHSLTIDQQTQKIYWFMPVNNRLDIYSSNFNGENMQSLVRFTADPDKINANDHPNSLTTKKFLFIVDWCISCSPRLIWRFSKPISTFNFKVISKVHTESVVGIVANYKLKEQLQGISECDHVINDYEKKISLKIAREYEGPFCVHGVRDIGQSLCKCAPGYIGERCDESICENYCLQGDCSLTQEGLPECRCYAGSSGERCEVNMCHDYCLNNGTCSLNKENEPVCECVGEYEGRRCEVETDKNKAISTNSSYFLVEKNITLALLLENWSKRAHKFP